MSPIPNHSSKCFENKKLYEAKNIWASVSWGTAKVENKQIFLKGMNAKVSWANASIDCTQIQQQTMSKKFLERMHVVT